MKFPQHATACRGSGNACRSINFRGMLQDFHGFPWNDAAAAAEIVTAAACPSRLSYTCDCCCCCCRCCCCCCCDAAADDNDDDAAAAAAALLTFEPDCCILPTMATMVAAERSRFTSLAKRRLLCSQHNACMARLATTVNQKATGNFNLLLDYYSQKTNKS